MGCKYYDELERYNSDICYDGPSKDILYHKYNILVNYDKNYYFDDFEDTYPEYIDIEGFSKIIGMSISTIRAYIRKGIIPPPIKSEKIFYHKEKGIHCGSVKHYWDIYTIMDWFENMKEILDLTRKKTWKNYGNYCETFKGKCEKG